MSGHEGAVALDRVRLRVCLAWTGKTGLATVTLAMFGLIGLLVTAIGVTEADMSGLLIGTAMTVLFFGLAVVLAVQRCRKATVLELGDFGVRGYS